MIYISHCFSALEIVNWRYSPKQDRKGWLSSDIQMYTGCAWDIDNINFFNNSIELVMNITNY